MTNLFTYGSLMFKEVIYALTTTKDYNSSKGTLQGYGRRHVKNKVYPGIYKLQGSKVQGVVYYNVSNSDMQFLNQFQSTQYIPTSVDIHTSQGVVKAIAYVYAYPANLSDIQWSAEQFEKNHKDSFAHQHQNSTK